MKWNVRRRDKSLIPMYTMSDFSPHLPFIF